MHNWFPNKTIYALYIFFWRSMAIHVHMSAVLADWQLTPIVRCDSMGRPLFFSAH